MTHAPLTLGIDFGGTGIKLGLVDVSGRLLKTVRFATPLSHTPEDTATLIVQQGKALIAEVGRRRIIGVGVGAAGDIDPVSGIIRISPNLNWRNVPLKRLLARGLSYPITLDNDANVAAWAAYVVEGKRRIKDLVCITLGTGVGGGIVLEGKLYRGTTGSAGEIGHMTLYPEGAPCACGNRGCLERYVGARAMIEAATRALEAGEKTILRKWVGTDLSKLTPKLIEQAARKKDTLARNLWTEAGERLGIGLATLVNMLNPEWIVLAGGLSRAGGLLTDPTQRVIMKRAFATPARAARLVISKLDQDLGIVGAGLVAHEIKR